MKIVLIKLFWHQKDLNNSELINTKKFIEVPNTVEISKNIYKYKKSNYKIYYR